MRRPQKIIFTLTMASAGLFAPWAGLRAQTPIVPVAPLTQSAPPTISADAGVALASAQRAQDLGMPSVAADLYRQLRTAPGADRVALNYALATALLDAGKAAEVESLLAELPEPHGAAWRLRAGLAALQLGNRDAAQAEWDAIKLAEVSESDLPWYYFFTGALYDTAAVREVTRANQNYLTAENLARTELSRARFQLAGEVVRMALLSKPTEAAMRLMREQAERYAGRSLGYDSAKSYAIMLAESGKRDEGVKFLQQTLLTVSPTDREFRDGLRFILGLIGDRGRGGAGRNALLQLLETGVSLQRQRQALQLLAEASRTDDTRALFKSELNRLIGARPPHPALESLYYFRAQLALTENDYVRAEEAATALVKQFPLSPLRLHALVVMAQSAWEQQRYRAAADYAQKARTEMAPAADAAGATPKPPVAAVSPRLRADLGVLEAEAWFRARDYRNSADAYAAVLRDRPAEFDAGRVSALMFHRILAEIRAAPAESGKVIDELARDPALQVEHRWQAEWQLARALQLQGAAGIKEAYTRVTALLAKGADSSALSPDLRAKMAWLQARLAFDTRDAAETIRLVDAQLNSTAEIDPRLKIEIASTLLLLKARSELALNRESVALESLKRLRAEYPRTEAAISSYLIEAEYYADQDKIDEARNRLISLTDNPDPEYKRSPYVPYALYRLALLSERLGREENLKEANQRIEDMFTLVKTLGLAADPTLSFAARMRQGDIFRKRNDFASAQRAYEDLVNRYAQRPDVVLAQLALADCHNAQSSETDESHANAAQLLYEQLRDRVDAPRDVRVEAGYKLGALLVRRGKVDEAVKVWWLEVVDPFLRKDPNAIETEAKRPYWFARTLCELGDLQEKRGQTEEAKAAYLLVLEKQLPYGETIARSRLQQLGVPAPVKSGQ